MTHRIKSIIFIGIVALAAIIAGYIVLDKAAAPEDTSSIPPALRASRERAKASSTPSTVQKSTTKSK